MERGRKGGREEGNLGFTAAARTCDTFKKDAAMLPLG